MDLQTALSAAYARLKPLADEAGLPNLWICPRVGINQGQPYMAFDFSAKATPVAGDPMPPAEVSAFGYDGEATEKSFTLRLLEAQQDLLQKSHQLNPCQVGEAHAASFRALSAAA